MMMTLLTTAAYAQSTDLPGEEYLLVNGSLVHINDLPQYTEGIIEIQPPNQYQRVDSDGSFTFDVGYSVTSTKFQVSSTSTTINLRAHIEGPTGDDVTDDYPNHRYQIIFYKVGSIIDPKIDDSYFYADGTQNSWTVSGLNTSDTYYFKIINTDYLPNGTTVVGSGSLTNYVHPN